MDDETFLLAPHDPSVHERIEWQTKQLEQMMLNQRPLTLLSAAAVAFTVIGSDAHMLARVVAAPVFGASLWMGIVCGWTVTSWMHHIERRDWDHATRRFERARDESSSSQALLIAGSCGLAAGYTGWWWGTLVVALGLYGFVKFREHRLPTESTPLK